MPDRRLVVGEPGTVWLGVGIAAVSVVCLLTGWLPALDALLVLALVAVAFVLMLRTGALRLVRRRPAPKMALPSVGDPWDVCTCGDFRREHVPGACRLCMLSASPFEVCRGFQLWIGAREWTEQWGEVPDAG